MQSTPGSLVDRERAKTGSGGSWSDCRVALLEPAWWNSKMMPFGWLASYTNADIDTPSYAWSVVGQGLTLACALADKQNASTIVARFSAFSDILHLLQRKLLDDRGLKLLRAASRFVTLATSIGQRTSYPRWPIAWEAPASAHWTCNY